MFDPVGCHVGGPSGVPLVCCAACQPEQSPKGGEYPTVSEVKVREGETFESALRRFNKKIKQNGILSEVRRREHYEKPSVRRKRKLVAAKKRRLKAG